MRQPRPSPRRLFSAVGLFFLAPLVGEFLLGNLPITWLWVLPVLALLYGGGALLIREVARRWGLGWAGLASLGLAYGVIEEAFVTQSLFNPDYLGLRLLDFGYLPAPGIGAWWTVYVLGLHAVWSTAVPIALVEAVTPAARRAPWLGRFGLGLTATLFATGCLAVAHAQPAAATHASAGQHLGSAIAVAALVLLGFVLGRRSPPPTDGETAGRSAPPPLVVGATAFACGSAFMAIAAIVQTPSVGHVSPQVDLLGNAVLTAASLALLVTATARVAREPGAGSSWEERPLRRREPSARKRRPQPAYSVCRSI